MSRGHVVHKVQREPEGIVELEQNVAGNAILLFRFDPGDGLVQQGKTGGECCGEALLLEEHQLGHVLPAVNELGIGLAHLVHDRAGQFEQEGLRRCR